MGVLIPYVTSWIIDEGIAKSHLGNVYKYGAIMLVLAAMSMLFGILAGRLYFMPFLEKNRSKYGGDGDSFHQFFVFFAVFG